MTCLCKSTFTVSVNYTDIYFILCQNTAEENEVYLGEFGKGFQFQTYIDLKIKHVVYDFMCTYVRRIKPDARWKKLLVNCPGSPFICCITPSDIAYVLAIIKNGKEMWDQVKGQESRNKSRETDEAIIQRGRGKEEREWYVRVE